MIKRGINIILISFIVLVAFFACQKIEDNKISPVIMLNGGSLMTVKLGCAFEDPWVTVHDDKDSSRDIKITREPDTIPDSASTYYIKYIAEDSDGNFAFAERKVIVAFRLSDEYNGPYKVYDTVFTPGGTPTYDTSSYAATVVVRNSYPQWIEIENFNNFGPGFTAFLTHDSAGRINVSFDLHDTVISGNGYNFCNDNGFSLHYNVKTPDDTTFHRTSFFYQY